MYKCKICGNIKYFTELKNIATKVICTDEGLPLPILSQDILLSIVEIYCDICRASTEDKEILDDEGRPIDLSEQEDPPDIQYSG
jgi:hypothetical protein